MKNYILLIALAILCFTCSESNKGTPIKLPQVQVNTNQLDKAVQFTSGLLNDWNQGIYNPIGQEKATGKFAKGFMPELQKEFFEGTVMPTYGKFQLLVYVEAYKLGAQNIYRFKGIFEKGGEPEVRVAMDEKNRVTGLWIKPWHDDIQ